MLKTTSLYKYTLQHNERIVFPDCIIMFQVQISIFNHQFKQNFLHFRKSRNKEFCKILYETLYSLKENIGTKFFTTKKNKSKPFQLGISNREFVGWDYGKKSESVVLDTYKELLLRGTTKVLVWDVSISSLNLCHVANKPYLHESFRFKDL